MIFCNGCSKSGTHILTNICKSINKKQIGGTIIKRFPESNFIMKGEAKLDFIFSRDNSYYIHSHIAYSEQLELTMARHKHLHIFRNPREISVSWMRHRAKQNTSLELSKDLLISLIKSGMFGISVPRFYLGFINWKGKSRALFLDFDMMTSRKQDLSIIERYLNLPPETLHYDNILGNSSTYTGSYSIWKEWWDDDVESAWVEAGGLIADQAFDSLISKKKP